MLIASNFKQLPGRQVNKKNEITGKAADERNETVSTQRQKVSKGCDSNSQTIRTKFVIKM